MAQIVNILGPTGSGKTHSLVNLDSTKTVVIDPCEKLLFPGSGKKYSSENKNYFKIDSTINLEEAIKQIDKNMPHINTIIIDDAEYFMTIELFDKVKVKGYDKFTEIANNMYKVLKAAKSARKDLNIVFLWHVDKMVIDGFTTDYKIRMPGKMIEEKFNPLELSNFTIFSTSRFDKAEGQMKYEFVIKATEEYLKAKSPLGAFEESIINNDLKVVLDRMNDYINQ